MVSDQSEFANVLSRLSTAWNQMTRMVAAFDVQTAGEKFCEDQP